MRPALALLLALAACRAAPKPAPAPAPADAGPADAGPVDAGPTQVGCAGCTVLRGGTVFDGERAGLGTVVLEGDHVAQVAFGPVEVEAGQVLDATGQTVLPGLIDLHVHTPATGGPRGFYPQQDETQAHLKAMLRSGVTSYLDLGSSAHTIFEYRARVRSGALLAPNLFAVGPLLTPTGGHPCYRGSPAGDGCGFVDGIADAQARLDALLPQGPDLVKVVLEPGANGHPLPELTTEALTALQSRAQAGGVRLIAHVSTSADLLAAIGVGVRLFAHVPSYDLLTPDQAAQVAASGAVIVPTLSVLDNLYRTASQTLVGLSDGSLDADVPADVRAALQDPQQLGRLLDPSYVSWAQGERDRSQANFRTLLAAGAHLAAGTDSGNPGTFHGVAMRQELALYVANGMAPLDALRAGTRSAAEVLGRDDLGRLAPGARADVLVVDGDATSDVAALARVARVYRAGQPLDRAALAVTGSLDLRQPQATGLALGQACLGQGECGTGLVCDYQGTCRAACSRTQACAAGQGCLPTDFFGDGFCQPSDGCDLFAQDCVNGAACTWIGSGATLCSIASAGTDGQACGAYGQCAPGAQCNYGSNQCRQLCDPRADAGGCPGTERCLDRTSSAGTPVGQCQ